MVCTNVALEKSDKSPSVSVLHTVPKVACLCVSSSPLTTALLLLRKWYLFTVGLLAASGVPIVMTFLFQLRTTLNDLPLLFLDTLFAIVKPAVVVAVGANSSNLLPSKPFGNTTTIEPAPIVVQPVGTAAVSSKVPNLTFPLSSLISSSAFVHVAASASEATPVAPTAPSYEKWRRPAAHVVPLIVNVTVSCDVTLITEPGLTFSRRADAPAKKDQPSCNVYVSYTVALVAS